MRQAAEDVGLGLSSDNQLPGEMATGVGQPAAERPLLDAAAVQKILPHRYPFLLIDKVLELVDGERIVAVKNVSLNEEYFVGHFPGYPVMPGVLILEAMAQAGAILAMKSSEGVGAGKLVFLVGATDCKWKRQVTPGDQLRIEMVSVRRRRPLWIMDGTVTVDGVVVATATIRAAEGDR